MHKMLKPHWNILELFQKATHFSFIKINLCSSPSWYFKVEEKYVNESTSKKRGVRHSVPEASLSCLPGLTWLASFSCFTASLWSFPHLLCLVFNMKRNAEAESNARLLYSLSGYWKSDKTMWWWKRRKNQQEAIFFCAGLFSLIWSAVKGGHYVTSSAHTWPTVWLPNTRGEW